MLQDSALINKLRVVLTSRVLRWFEDEAKRNPHQFNKFVVEFANFLREGCWYDPDNKERILKLLRFPTSAELPEPEPAETAADDKAPEKKDKDNDEDEWLPITSLAAYADRMKPFQKAIYYLVAQTREAALASPYYEPFKARGIEVLLLTEVPDEMIFTTAGKFDDKPFVRIDAENVQLPDDTEPKQEQPDAARLTSQETDELIVWLKKTLEGSVVDVKVSKRLVEHPAIVTGHDSATDMTFRRSADRRMAAMLRHLPKNHKLEINPGHPVIVALHRSMDASPDLARLVAKQLLDTALIAAGAHEDPRMILQQLNALMEAALRPK
eukprot:Unigene6405_Nuclearia_a/m.19735 Unigene6405_Nuclearia_a/g.19735  ORF Unigene6405_Nuclearia_a/g.19735 Unigene6405_Nuclearia_a/m.19735 type:complete len:325 (+) Unigene6405_Nuclearia_a:2-976(+)